MRHVALLIVGVFASPLAAQEASHHCASIAASTERLSCYDKAFPLPPEVVVAAARQAQAAFGLVGPDQASAGVEGAVPDRIQSRLAEVDYGSGGQRRFQLENGQVWMQADARSNGHVQQGELVELRKGALGSHQLVTSAGVMVRVRRVR